VSLDVSGFRFLVGNTPVTRNVWLGPISHCIISRSDEVDFVCSPSFHSFPIRRSQGALQISQILFIPTSEKPKDLSSQADAICSCRCIQCFVRFGRKSVVVQGVAIGAAWGVMSALVNYVAYLHDFYTQDASIYTNLCPINFWVASASFACAFSILHIVLSTLAWQAYVVENRWMKVSNLFLIYLVHLGFAELGLGNLSANGCIWTMAVTWSVLGALCLLTTYFTLKSLKKIAQP